MYNVHVKAFVAKVTNIPHHPEKILNAAFNLYTCIFMRFSETIDDPIREPDSEKLKGHSSTPLFLFCFGVLNVYF